MADWQAIKTEYITTDTSYRKLAQKYDVHYQAICQRSKAEGWIAQREQYRNDTITDIIDETGRVKNAPEVATTVGYTITVTSGSTTKTIKLYTVVPGTTSWQKWNGIYKSSLIWNDGDFVVNK